MQDVRFTLQMKAKFPVRAKTPPSTVYQYYEPGLRGTRPRPPSWLWPRGRE
jgi:hypothetical protein